MPDSAPAATTPATPALDLTALEERLKNTSAIGLFTKLSLKNQVDDLVSEFRAFHNGDRTLTLAQLRQRFEVLLLKVVMLLQDDDPELASAVSSSRAAIWSVLSNPGRSSRSSEAYLGVGHGIAFVPSCRPPAS